MHEHREVERLLGYYPFDRSVVETVADVANRQRSRIWPSITSSLPEIKRYVPRHGKPIDVLDIIPEAGYDDVLVYHPPMAMALNANMVMRVATLALAEPSKRIITAGNPGAPGQDGGKLRTIDLPQVWKGTMPPTVEPVLEYLVSQHIHHSKQAGYSYGADKAAALSAVADRYDHEVRHGIFMEPASVVIRGLGKLLPDFMRSNAALDAYVQATQCEPYYEARRVADRQGHRLPGYFLSLLRPSNVAIAHALSLDGFEARVDAALTKQSEGEHPMVVSNVWGTDSEIAIHTPMFELTNRLIEKFGPERVERTSIDGGKHAMGDDIFLHTALIMQAEKSFVQ